MYQLTSLFCGILTPLVNFCRLGIIFLEIRHFGSKGRFLLVQFLDLDIVEGVAPGGSSRADN